jgi:hypothetical protein
VLIGQVAFMPVSTVAYLYQNMNRREATAPQAR